MRHLVSYEARYENRTDIFVQRNTSVLLCNEIMRCRSEVHTIFLFFFILFCTAVIDLSFNFFFAIEIREYIPSDVWEQRVYLETR